MTVSLPRDLQGLRAAIHACRICRDCPTQVMALPHEPRPVVVLSSTARILIAGQAPGKRVHETGLPFNDASGDRLRQWLGVDREAFYDSGNFAILPMGFCFPGYDTSGHDLPPRRECAPHWREAAMEVVPQVELVLAIGQYAQRWHMGDLRKPTLHATVESWRESFFTNRPGPKILPLPHPSWRNSGWLRRNPWFEAELLPILKKQVDHCLR
ncbi:uracil-DNA glycosylase family protein [Agrobacterium vitis]|uniref:uracil-DNA glycosylase family protein n=1 Tax=Rhizobium/Agrobacterium group TaxID=227290 RepID=UPI0012E8DAB2|nr:MULTISPECIES: uracil-DNA glycosylase family protein [Rhizobium/Agrobacterium group]MCF1448636.1 uracil-DNA glycosylase family protein [Allorhizobium ampelinum]MCF1494677.1 uracil-DNA glycosylase family protein [Allorhizobium ampelinum]MVA45047.1 uracil-DNA glycosylase family protein [Agrobacterium vitis]